MSESPNTAEQYSAYIPARQTLMALGCSYPSSAACLDMRGGNHGVLAPSAGQVSAALTGTKLPATAPDRRSSRTFAKIPVMVDKRNTGAYIVDNRTLHASAPACAPGGSFFAFFTSDFKGFSIEIAWGKASLQ